MTQGVKRDDVFLPRHGDRIHITTVEHLYRLMNRSRALSDTLHSYIETKTKPTNLPGFLIYIGHGILCRLASEHLKFRKYRHFVNMSH